MEVNKAYLPKGEIKEFKKGTSLFEILDCKVDIDDNLVAIIDGEEVEDLSKKLYYDVSIKPIKIDEELGEKTYLRTLQMVFLMAVKDIYKDFKVVFKNALSRGLYGEIENISITQENIDIIKEKMQEIISEKIEIEKIKLKKSEAIKIFEEYNMDDKIKNMKYIDFHYISIYRCKDYYDYYYGNMLVNTGYLTVFDLVKNKNGFVIVSPKKDSGLLLKEFKDSPKIAEIFNETQRVSDILDVSNIGALNEKVELDELNHVVLVAESLHEKKIGEIADKISSKKDNLKVVTIGGPDSSGKFTFTKRLSIQLRLLGFDPYIISLDDYLLDRKYVSSETSKYQLQTIKGIDINLFDSHIKMLLEGEGVDIPQFDVSLEKKVGIRENFKMNSKSVLLVYGVHGLNNELLRDFTSSERMKIYVSSLTQLSMDNHNTMEPKDVRRCRKIVLNYKNFNIKADETIEMFNIIDKVENESVFLMQEEADAMFNSTVIYEMSILRKYIEPLLKSIPKRNPSYVEGMRLLDFVSLFNIAEEKNIPQNSIIREFIGKSCF